MSDVVVCKFGGSSVANAEQVEKVGRIVAADARRRFVVVSAPGRANAAEEKVTDHLLNVATHGKQFQERRTGPCPSDSRKAVLAKFSQLITDLALDGGDILAGLERDFATTLEGDKRTAFLASRGEHYAAKIVARHFRKSGLDARVALPEDFGLLVSGDYLDAKVDEAAYERIAKLGTGQGVAVIPGFYGINAGGDIAVFSRGGSDLTGGEIAYALDAKRYENWTDVSGVLEADPAVIPEARAIPRLTFKEIRLLASKGVNVFHLDAMLRCQRREIPIHVRNTNRPEEAGTLILNERVPEEGIVGLARLDNIAYIYLQKSALSEDVSFTAELFAILEDFGIHTHHYPTDKDDIAVVVDQEDLKGAINDLRRTIDKRLKPEFMEVVYNLAIITPVGLGLKRNSYAIVDAISALGRAHIPIEMIGQSPSQICFHIGTQQAVADDAMRILYDALIKRSA